MKSATDLTPTWREEPQPDLSIEADDVLPLDAAVQVAISNNRDLRAELDAIAQAKADLVQAGLLPNPVVSILLRLPEGGGLANLDFGLTQDLASLWLIPSRKRAAQATLQQQILFAIDIAITTARDVKTEYAAYQFQIESIVLQEQNLKILSDLRDLTRARVRAGEVAELDVNLIQARFLGAQQVLYQLRSDARTSQQRILRLMGVAQSRADWKPAPLQPPPAPRLADDEQVVELALLRRLDAQAASWRVESAVADVQQQKLRFIPTLAIGIFAERSERRAQPGRKVLADTARSSIAAGRLTAPELQSVGERRRERRQEIDLILGPSLEVPVPIFDQNQAQIAKAQARTRELQKRYEELQQRIIESIRATLARKRLAEQRFNVVQNALLPQQEANLELARRGYQAGRESVLTILLAQEALITTRLDLASVVRDLVVANADLERELGGRIPDSIMVPASQPASAPSTSESP